LAHDTATVGRDDVVTIDLRASGGFIAHFSGAK
jgi:hypothetical protein